MGKRSTQAFVSRLMELRELWLEAAEARKLSMSFKDRAAVRDLKNYASALERMLGESKSLH